MPITIEIPKFRKVRRLIRWVGDQGIHERLPADREAVFFKEYEKNPDGVAGGVVNYSGHVGPLPDMEHMLKGSGRHIVAYAKNIRHHGRTLPDEIRDSIEDDKSLVDWAKEFGRLPPHLENRITSAEHVFRYSQFVNVQLPEDMEDRVFRGKDEADALLRYLRHHSLFARDSQRECLKTNRDVALCYLQYVFQKKGEVPTDIRDSLAGNDHCLYQFAQMYGRLPEHLENTLMNPGTLLDYAANILRGRLPEELEFRLMPDKKVMVNYAFKVVRGFAPCRLSDALHASIVLDGNANDPDIKRYIAACDSDPNRMGNK